MYAQVFMFPFYSSSVHNKLM